MPVEELVVTGGLRKNPLVMQVYADVLGMPLSVCDSDQGPALGSAIHAAVAAGAYPDIRKAAPAMGRRTEAAWVPDPDRHATYDLLYAEYRRLVDHFGDPRDNPLHRLGDLRRTALSRRTGPVPGDHHAARSPGPPHRPRRRAEAGDGRAARAPARQRPRRLDRGQRLAAPARHGPVRHQGLRRPVRRPDRRRHGRLRPSTGASSSRDRAPSSDTDAHAYVYRHRPDVGGQVHTHSTYATAWAARGEPIPCVLTMMADEFGGEIPVGPFALIGDDSIGRGIVATLQHSRSPAVLMQNHGVFTVGRTGRAAVKAAVMCEDVARTGPRRPQLGSPLPIAADDVDRLFDRYQHAYGQ